MLCTLIYRRRSLYSFLKAPFNSYLTTLCPASFNITYTNPDDIEKIIRNLRPKSSAGSDNISIKLLKEIENVVSRPLSIIINQSLCTGIFPDRLKTALCKKDDNKLFGNYRPISLLSSISKIFERVAFNQLCDYFSSNGLLYEANMDSGNFTRPNWLLWSLQTELVKKWMPTRFHSPYF